MSDYYSGDQVEICLGNNPDHTKNKWVYGVVLGPSKDNSAEWYVNVEGKPYCTHWANLRAIPLCKPILFTEEERTTIMWAIGKKHVQRVGELGNNPDDLESPTDSKLIHFHGILTKLRAARR